MITDKLIDDAVAMVSNNIETIAVGTGSEPDTTSTALDGKILEKAASVFIDDNTVISELYIDETECNDIQLTNAGVFDDVQLYAGGIINEQKNSTESLTVSIEITVERN